MTQIPITRPRQATQNPGMAPTFSCSLTQPWPVSASHDQVRYVSYVLQDFLLRLTSSYFLLSADEHPPRKALGIDEEQTVPVSILRCSRTRSLCCAFSWKPGWPATFMGISVNSIPNPYNNNIIIINFLFFTFFFLTLTSAAHSDSLLPFFLPPPWRWNPRTKNLHFQCRRFQSSAIEDSVGSMADFRTSTHRSKWIFTPQILVIDIRSVWRWTAHYRNGAYVVINERNLPLDCPQNLYFPLLE